MIKERCWFSQIKSFVEYFSTSDLNFVSFQPILCHPHTQIRIILFHDVQRDIPNLEFSPNHASIGFSQIAFPIIVLPKGDRTDSAQEEQLGLPYWTMILAICVVVDESVRGVSWSEVATVPKRKSHRGLDLDLSLNSEKNIWKGWKKSGGTKQKTGDG